MFDYLAGTFYDNVVAAYDEYVSYRDSPSAGRNQHLRTAVATATALYHFHEHLTPELKEKTKNLKMNFDDFELMRGVANAAKHKIVDRGSKIIDRADDIYEEIVIILYDDEIGGYSHSQTMICVACSDGTKRWLDRSITQVLNFWGELLKDANVCAYTARAEPPAPGHRYLSRDEASTRLDLEALAVLDFRPTFVVIQFDNTLGRLVPTDLTTSDIQFRIYRPPEMLVDLTISHPDHGDLTASIPLSPGESAEFQRIRNESELEAFRAKLFQAHNSEFKRIIREKLSDHARRRIVG